jgi:hypothetical protein
MEAQYDYHDLHALMRLCFNMFLYLCNYITRLVDSVVILALDGQEQMIPPTSAFPKVFFGPSRRADPETVVTVRSNRGLFVKLMKSCASYHPIRPANNRRQHPQFVLKPCSQLL